MRSWICQLSPLALCACLTGCAGWPMFGNATPAAPSDATASKPEEKTAGGSSWIKPVSWFQHDKAEEEAAKPTPPTSSASRSWLNPSSWFDKKKSTGPADSLVLQGDQLTAESADNSEAGKALAAAHELYRQEDYAQAAKAFKEIAEDEKVLPRIAEEARFYLAESYYRDRYYRLAVDHYYRMLTDFPNGAHREEACQRMFDVANFWLEDTRAEMELYKQKEEGKRWFVVTPVVHFEREKPWIDVEGHALQALERVYLNDMRGPLADRSLFLIATVKFYREDYVGADQYFSQLVELYPNSKLASRSVELGIISKQLSTGGADYDGRKVAQARRLINAAFANYPDLAQDKREFLMKQLASCNLQQAEKDFKTAEFYRRTRQPGSAYFYYEIVRRRYPGTEYFDKATARMHELRAAAEKHPVKETPPPQTPPRAPADNDTLPAPRPLPPTLTPSTPLDGSFAPMGAPR